MPDHFQATSTRTSAWQLWWRKVAEILEAMEASPFDVQADRIRQLERDVAHLREVALPHRVVEQNPCQ